MSTVEPVYDFRIAGSPARVYSGDRALEQLPAEVARHGARRAFVVCGRSVAAGTPLLARVQGLLGERFAGAYTAMRKDTPQADVLAARDLARDAGADLLIAIGAGSVVQGARMVAILLAETAPVEELMTRYPPGRPAVSPRLLAPKLPIVNVLTVGTGAQNRGGSPMKAANGRRLEFFDPKTRPVAIFWDREALATAPVAMVRQSGGTIWWSALMNMGYTRATPLSDFSRRQVFELVSRALPRLGDPHDTGARFDLCLATFLMNREVDDGAIRGSHWVRRVVYAFGSALFNLHEEVAQGAAFSAFTPQVLRRLGPRDPGDMCAIARALGVWRDGDPPAEAPARAAAATERVFASLDMPCRLAQLGIPRTSAPRILEASLTNFNADPRQEFAGEKDLLREVLDEAW